jgi:3-isopropylmalate/(R)-2-methylmalate dehydratase large subunit
MSPASWCGRTDAHADIFTNDADAQRPANIRNDAMGMTMVEKILARGAGRSSVQPGEIVTVKVDTSVLIDVNFWDGYYHEFLRVFDPEKIVVVFDHIIPPKDEHSAIALERGRQFAKKFGIRRVHDVGYDQGISHQLIADNAYALPGSILTCIDSHTCSAGALNCLARGLGNPESVFVTAKGHTWFKVCPTIRYILEGTLQPGVSTKDVFLHIADRYGDHANFNVEFVGPGIAGLSLNARRALATMCAEISAEFALFEADDLVLAHVRAQTEASFEPQFADPGAAYAGTRRLDLATIEPLVALPHTVVNNARPLSGLDRTPIQQAFVGSCANGSIEDLEIAARILAGRRVSDDVRFIITPGSQAIYREAMRRGLIATLSEAGALVTHSTCGACAGLHVGVLGPGERCITASTRNFKGRMGSPSSEIFMASPATVAASALRGEITDPRPYLEGRV